MNFPEISGSKNHDERKQGLHRILSSSSIYEWFQAAIGGKRARKYIMHEVVTGLSKRSRVLDIGCGTGYVLDYIDEALEVDYHGYDLDCNYIKYAKVRYGDRGQFICKRVNSLDLDAKEPFDLILALGLLHHLNDLEAQKLVELGWDALEIGGRMVFLDGVFENDQRFLRRYILNTDRGKHVRNIDGYLELIKPNFSKISYTIERDLFYIPYTCSIIVCEK